MSSKKSLHYVSEDRLDEISIELSRLKGNKDFDLVRQHRTYHGLNVDARRHSVKIEMPNGKTKRSGRATREAEQNLAAAHTYFSRRYEGDLSERLIMETVSLIVPELRPISYRSRDDGIYRALGMDMVYPKDVSELMPSFVAENNALVSSVDKAVHAHLHLARIHPFKDGNGRLSRLIQDGILEHSGLPPMIIDFLERDEYLTLINSAQKSYEGSDRPVTPEIAKFCNFLADSLLSSLRSSRKYISK